MVSKKNDQRMYCLADDNCCFYDFWSEVVIAEEVQTAPSTTAVALASPSAILMEASTGTVLFEKNPDEIRSPASITKIMTLILTFEAIERGGLN